MAEPGDGPLEGGLPTAPEHLLWILHEQIQKELKDRTKPGKLTFHDLLIIPYT